MLDGQWRTLQEIAAATGDPHASISAQLRHLRKPRFGSFVVNREYRGNGVYGYQLLQSDVEAPKQRPGRSHTVADLKSVITLALAELDEDDVQQARQTLRCGLGLDPE